MRGKKKGMEENNTLILGVSAASVRKLDIMGEVKGIKAQAWGSISLTYTTDLFTRSLATGKK